MPDLERCVDALARLGYDGIEIAGDPGRPAAAVAPQVNKAGLTVTSVCAVFSPERDYAHPEPGPRRAAISYLRNALDQAGELEAGAVVVVPTYRTEPLSSRADEFARAAESIDTALEGHPTDGPKVALEPLNLYETHLVRTLDDADRLRRAIDHPRVGLMADCFHMNIEERSPLESVRTHAAELVHVHLADSNRREPGAGHVDFDALCEVLNESGYQGALAMEFLPWSEEAGGRAATTVQMSIRRLPTTEAQPRTHDAQQPR